MKKYCYTCMDVLQGNGFCPHCFKKNSAECPPYRLSPGTVLNRKYLVGKSIGEGGFGITYIGRDLTLDRKVAIKEYYPSGCANRNNIVSQDVTISSEKRREYFEKGLHSFIDEARRIAKLTSVPGIVDVLEYFECNGTAYIIMEYLDGENLSDYLKNNGTIGYKEVFGMMLPVTRSLSTMHDAGIIHRDISPDNIMRLKDGTLKLMDFGSARYFTNSDKEMSVMIKQGYAPEEQYSSGSVQGPWTDVYALCATMYKCITGKVPAYSIDRIKIDTLIRPSDMGCSISPSAESVLLYGLAVFRQDRCSDMNELGSLMEQALQHDQPVVEPRQDYYNNIHKTMYGNNAPNFEYQAPASFNRQPPYGDGFNVNTGNIPTGGYQYNAAPVQNKKSGKSTAIVLITTLLCVGIIAATGYFVYSRLVGGDVETTDTTSSHLKSDDDGNSEQKENAGQDNGNSDSGDTDQHEDSSSKKSEAETTAKEREYSSATKFTDAEASSTHGNMVGEFDKKVYTYSPTNVLKKNGTCWCEGAEGYGEGESLTLKLPEVQKLSGIKLLNGYVGNETQYNNNSKPSKIRLSFSGGEKVEVELKVYPADKRNTIQKIQLDTPVYTDSVTITILEVSESSDEDTCISYAEPY